MYFVLPLVIVVSLSVYSFSFLSFLANLTQLKYVVAHFGEF